MAAESTPFQFESVATKAAVAPAAAAEIPVAASGTQGAAKGIVPNQTGYQAVRTLQSKFSVSISSKFHTWKTNGR